MKYILGLILVGLLSSSIYAQDQRNVLLIVADDLGRKDIGYNNGEWPTPNIDRLFSQGEVFTRFYSWSTCAPSRHALFSGRQPDSSWSKFDTDDPGETLAEQFKDRGYQTALFGKWQLGWSPTDNGFDTYFGPDVSESFRNFRRDTQTEILTDKALDWIDARDTLNQPYFLAVTYTAVHSPIEVGNTYKDRAGGSDFGGLVIALDDGIGRLVSAVGEDTIIMFVSDNGGNESLGSNNNPLRGGKHELFEGGVRVLATIYDKSNWIGVINDGIYGVQDVEEILLTQSSSTPRPFSNEYIMWNLYGGKQKYYVDDRWKLIHKRDRRYLFDLENDPKEENNVYNSKPNRVQEIESLFNINS